MFIPAVAVLVTNWTTRGDVRSIGCDRFPLQYLPVALFLMPALMHAAMLPAAAFAGRLRCEDWLTPHADGLFHTPARLGWGVLTAAGLTARIVMNALAGLIIVSVLALFEEVGWRAWLLPRLAPRMGAARAVVVSSVIWALWHTPYALSGIQHLDGVPALLTAAIVPIGIAGSGLIIGWLWLRTESIWIVALAHGSLNNWGQYVFKFVAGPGQLRDAIVLGAGGLALVCAGSLLLSNLRPRSGAGPRGFQTF
jgi:membrane protease YdiL (CAAX protease family)